MNLIPRNSMVDFDSLFNDFFHGLGRPALGTKLPDSLAGMRVDVHEGENGFEIHAELPGVKKQDINITLENDVLTISASKNTESEKKKKGKVIWKERSSGSISRSFSIGPGLTDKDIKANFSDGVLTLEVPKRNEVKAANSARKIPIK